MPQEIVTEVIKVNGSHYFHEYHEIMILHNLVIINHMPKNYDHENVDEDDE